jgi:P4 family phage/plasmid primase-like protien
MNQSIIDFAITNNLRFVPVVINYSDTELDEDGHPIKSIGGMPMGWKTLVQYAPEKCKKNLENGSTTKTHIIMNLSSPSVIVVDCDKEDAYNKFVELLQEKELYVETSITKSNRGEKYNIPYKRHFYFNIEEHDYEKFAKRFKGKYLGGGFDTFYLEKVQILENRKATLSNIPIISFEDYETIFDTMKSQFPGTTTQNSFEKVQPVKKEKKKAEDKNPLESKMETDTLKDEKFTDDQVLEKVLDGISTDRWNNYNDWKIISYIFTNEGLPNGLFHLYSEKKCPSKYNYEINQKCLDENKVIDNGYKVETLYYWLKKDNPKLFRELQLQKTDFWKILKEFNHEDVAQFYYALEPTKYLRSEATKEWYEYNTHNILKPKGLKPPSSMLNNISKTIKEAIEEQYEKIKPKIIKDAAGNIIPDKSYEDKIKLLDKCYRLIGSSTFTKGTIDYLTSLYSIDNVEEKADIDMTVLAFEDGCFDIKIGQFRPINPKDYITKTCGYNYPKQSNPIIKEDLVKIISSMFSNVIVFEYLLKVRGLSLFTNKLQSIFIHTGSGGNGKSILSALHSEALGQYFYQADSTFLTTVIVGGRPNPTLANCFGRRSLCISEPDDGSGSCKVNSELAKKLSGGEKITARDLNKSNITFKQTITADLLTNVIPKLSKLDGGIARRLKIINYPFSFVDKPNPDNIYEKLRDYNLASKLENPEYIKEYMLLMIEYAVKHFNDDISKLETPKEVKEQIEEYIEENNPINNWLTKCVIQNIPDKKVKTSEVHKHYLESKFCDVKLSAEAFSKIMAFNKHIRSKIGGIYYYKNIELIKHIEHDEACEIDETL